MTTFSGQADAPEVRCDLTDRQTNRQTDRVNYSNPRCACTPRVNKSVHEKCTFKQKLYTQMKGAYPNECYSSLVLGGVILTQISPIEQC